jgi:hypothetical protein
MGHEDWICDQRMQTEAEQGAEADRSPGGLLPLSSTLGNKKEQEEMSNGKKRITKTRVVVAIFLVGVIMAVAITGYRYYRTNRWITVQEGPDDWVVVDGELAQKNSAPCPQMILKQGKVKFLPNTGDKSQVLLGYKLTVGSEMGKTERDASKYVPYLYQVRFRFTLADKDGFPLQVVDGPTDYEIFEISKPRAYQNVCTTPIGDRTADRTDRVYVTYVLSATGPRPR